MAFGEKAFHGKDGRKMIRQKILGSADKETVGELLARNRGIGPGFDLLRILLAMAILIGHARWAAGGVSFTTMVTGEPTTATVINDLALADNLGLVQWVGITAPLKLAMVPAFFALSGFLVAGSALRLKTVSTFLAFRGLRIFPALVVEVALSAFVLGPLLTTLALSSYFSDPLLIRYLGNSVGHVWFLLPGLFADNPVPNIVNVNLWTLPAEFYCYLIAAVIMLSRVMYKRRLYTILICIATVVLAYLNHTAKASYPAGPFPTHVIMYYFFLGIAFFHWQNYIPVRFSVFTLSALISYFSLSSNTLIYVTPIFLTYCTIFFGMLHFKKSKLISSGDYSYGVYLYGFPISQSLVVVWPWFVNRPIPLVLATIVLTLAFAVFSWHCIEKHALKFKKQLPERLFPVPSKRHLQTSEL